MNPSTPLSDDERQTLAGEYVLGTLPAAERLADFILTSLDRRDAA